jgi:hypothetical protein
MKNTDKKVIASITFTHNATQNARTLTKYEDGTFSNDFDNAPISRYKELSFYIYQNIDNVKLQLATKYTQEVENIINEYRDFVKNEKALEKAIKEEEKRQAKASKEKAPKKQVVVNEYIYTGDEKIFNNVDEMLHYDDIDKMPALIVDLQHQNELRHGKTTKKLLLATYEKDLQNAIELVARCEKALHERNAQLDKVLAISQEDFEKSCFEIMQAHNNATNEKRKTKITKNDLYDENARLREIIAQLQAQAKA